MVCFVLAMAKKQDPVEILPVLKKGKILFMILFNAPLTRESANILKRTLAPLLVREWNALPDNEGLRIAELRRLVESQLGRKAPRFSLIFPKNMSMMDLDKKPA